MASVNEAVKRLKAKARPDQVTGMAKYGMAAEQRLGVSVPDMRLFSQPCSLISSSPRKDLFRELK